MSEFKKEYWNHLFNEETDINTETDVDVDNIKKQLEKLQSQYEDAIKKEEENKERNVKRLEDTKSNVEKSNSYEITKIIVQLEDINEGLKQKDIKNLKIIDDLKSQLDELTRNKES